MPVRRTGRTRTFEQERDQQRASERRWNRWAGYAGLVIIVAGLLWRAWTWVSYDPEPPLGCQFHSVEACSAD